MDNNPQEESQVTSAPVQDIPSGPIDNSDANKKRLKILIGAAVVVIVVILISIVLVSSLRSSTRENAENQASSLSDQEIAKEYVEAVQNYAKANNDLPCLFPDSKPGLALSDIDECTNELISDGELSRDFNKEADVTVYYTSETGTIYACTSDNCESGVVEMSKEYLEAKDLPVFTEPSQGTPVLSPTESSSSSSTPVN